MNKSVFAQQALLAEGWARDVLIDIDDKGRFGRITTGVSRGDASVAAGPVLPGMANVHSHAFQRALAGYTERAGPNEDSFWTWREAMYRFVSRLSPDQLEAISQQLFIEMLKQGYTSVGEFHYVHHGSDGVPYDDPTEMSERVISAARQVGLAITHLPVLYGFGGFAGAPLTETQKRFHNNPDALLRIVETLRYRHREDAGVRIGVAPHSLRAVTQNTLETMISDLHKIDETAPIHIHVAEQEKEVADCLAWSGKRPVEWLFEHANPDRRWCLIHATHTTNEELKRMAKSGVVVGICPTTEANLGDGLFPFRAYLDVGGAFAVGSDSHVSTSPVEELRWLEYGQRLATQRRNIAALPGRPSAGGSLWQSASTGGAQALARPTGAIAEGLQADLIVLDGSHANVAGRWDDDILDGLIFAGNDRLVRDVMVGGTWCIADGHHAMESAAAKNYGCAVAALLS